MYTTVNRTEPNSAKSILSGLVSSSSTSHIQSYNPVYLDGIAGAIQAMIVEHPKEWETS